MTINELKNDVAQLGFERYVEDEECFIASANRALSLIYVDRPVTQTAKLSFKGPRVSTLREFIEHRSGEEITIPFTGKSVSFRSSGTGNCTVRDALGTSYVSLTNDGQLTKMLVKGEGTITFSGDFYFTVSNLAFFDDLISKNVVDIPEYTPYREISATEYCDGFRSFSGYPTDKDGRVISSVTLADGRIRAPFDYRGELYLTYYRVPAPINADKPNDVIDVSDECAPMLPLLTASFMWLDDDAGKAQYYMTLYRDLIANVRRYSTNKIDTAYNGNGWA